MTGTTRPPRGQLTLADTTPRERQHLRTCVHEAGHAVAGVVLGALLRNSVVSTGRITGIQGLTSFSHDTPTWHQPSIAFAGPWAEARWLVEGRPSQRQLNRILDGSGYKDHRALCAAAARDVFGDPTAQARLSVPPLVERAWPAVVRVAQQLHRAGEVIQADVLAALGVDDGGGLTSSQLAGLRSGCRAVRPLHP